MKIFIESYLIYQYIYILKIIYLIIYSFKNITSFYLYYLHFYYYKNFEKFLLYNLLLCVYVHKA